MAGAGAGAVILKPGVRHSMQVSYGCQGPDCLASSAAFPGALSHKYCFHSKREGTEAQGSLVTHPKTTA